MKTRLADSLDETIAVELYKNFVLDLLSMLEAAEVQFQICFSPQNSHGRFVKWLGDKYPYMPQRGDDLGQKMRNALIEAFEWGFDRAIVIGSDSPDLPAELIDEAFSSLETHDAVIGPSLDGGYYLIGFNSNALLPRAFEGIRWSTDTVFGETLSKLEDAGLEIHRLPQWRDVDTFADLQNMFLRNYGKGLHASKTTSYISENRWLLQRLSVVGKSAGKPTPYAFFPEKH